MKKQTESSNICEQEDKAVEVAAAEEENEEEKKAIDLKELLEKKAVIIQRNWRRFATQNRFNNLKKEILRCRPLGKAIETDSEEEIDQKAEEQAEQKPEEKSSPVL